MDVDQVPLVVRRRLPTPTRAEHVDESGERRQSAREAEGPHQPVNAGSALTATGRAVSAAAAAATAGGAAVVVVACGCVVVVDEGATVDVGRATVVVVEGAVVVVVEQVVGGGQS